MAGVEIGVHASSGAARRSDRRIGLVVGQSYAPFDLSAAGFPSLRPLVGCGKVVYRGVRDDHHVFEHATGDRYEPVWRLRPPGPRGTFPRTGLHASCGELIATFTGPDHVWVSTQPAGLAVGGATVSFTLHHHRAADGRWVASAWDPAYVRPVGGFLAMAPLGSLRDLAGVVIPAIATGLLELSADGPGSSNTSGRAHRPERTSGRPADDEAPPVSRVGAGTRRSLTWMATMARWAISAVLVLLLAGMFTVLMIVSVFELVTLVDLPSPSFTLPAVLTLLLASGFGGRGRILTLGRRLIHSRRSPLVPHGLTAEA